MHKSLFENIIFLTITLNIITNCSSIDYRKYQHQMSDATKKQNDKQALKIANDKNFHKEKESILLKNLELGLSNYYNKNYCQATDFFDNASEISKKQYTKSISKSTTSAVSGGFDVYYEPTYEKSLMRFYQSLSNYNIYVNGACEKYDKKQVSKSQFGMRNYALSGKKLTAQQKNMIFNTSKANALEWKQWLDNDAKNDILQKVWDAFLAEQDGSRIQLQKARILYENIKQDANSRGKYLGHNKGLINQIINYADKQLKRLKMRKKANFGIMLFDNAISEKKASSNTSIAGTISSNVLDFATLITSPTLFTLIKTVGFSTPTMTYELPFIEKTSHNFYSYKIYNKKNKMILDGQMALIEPVSDLAFKDLEQKLPAIKAKKIAAAESSFTAAVVAANVAYMAASASADQIDNTIIKLGAHAAAVAGAITALNAAVKVVKKIMVTDVRQWVSVPSDILFALENLPVGEYELEILNNGKSIKRQNFTIDKERTNLIEIRN